MSLSFCHSLGGPPGTVLTQVVDEYNKDHGLKIQLVSVKPQDYAAAAKEALTKPPAERPAFLLAPEYMTGTMEEALEAGVVVSVRSLLDQDRLDDMAELVARTFVNCLAVNPACGVLYMNKSLLEKSGFASDWKPDALEDLVAACKQIKEKTGIPFGFTCAWPEAYLVEVVLAQKNLPLLDVNGEYDFVQLTGHLLYLRQLVNEGLFFPPATGNYDPTRKEFIEGRVAFYLQGSGHASTIEAEAKAAGFETGYASLPILAEGRKEKFAFPLGGTGIWVFNQDVEKKEETESSEEVAVQEMAKGVREFLNYLASREVQTRWHRDIACVPVSKSVPESLQEEGFYKDHPLHKAVVDQTHRAPLGENSFGIKKAGYHVVRPKLYPLVRELLYLEVLPQDEEKIIRERLLSFQAECNQKSL